MKNFILTLLIIFGFSFHIAAQSVILKGTVSNQKTGEPLIGATVQIVGTTNATMTDFDGNYSLQAEKGTYTIKASFVSYESQVIENYGVEKSTNELNFSLKESETEISEVLVTAKTDASTETAVINIKKNSGKISDGISAAEMSKLGDSNAASALKRVTGVSVQGEKYVYVRGLGDRYTKTTFNGAEIPSLDPEKNSVQMDLFPSNVLDNIIVNKTFTPDMPGESTGGHVDIVTKDFPEKFNLIFSTSIGYNPQANLNKKFIVGETGKFDWFATDGGARNIPAYAQQVLDAMPDRETLVISLNPAGGKFGYTETELADFSRSFDTNVAPTEKQSFLNHGHKFSVGNRYKLKDDKVLGINFAIDYNRKFNYYEEGEYGQYKNATLDDDKVVTDRKAQEDVRFAGLGNLNLKFNSNHATGIRFFRNQAGTSTARFRYGTYNYESAGTYIQERQLSYLERNFNSAQIHGKHSFGTSENPMTIDWLSSYTLMKQYEPDADFFTNLYKNPNADFTEADFEFMTNTAPTRIYNDMDEADTDNKINFQITFNNLLMKAGAEYIHKLRQHRQVKFELANVGANSNAYEGNFDIDGTLSEFLTNNLIAPDNQTGIFYMTDTRNNDANSYDANADIISAYTFADWKVIDNLRIIAGFRAENSTQYVKSLRTDILREGGYDRKTDFLPSINFKWELTDEMNLRIAGSRTVARPQFREIAPSSFFDYKRGMRINGNPTLKPSSSNNADFRWEYYMKRGELLALSAFYKQTFDPIEMELDTADQNYSVKYINTDKAQLYGIEAEARKYIGYGISAGGNFTYIKSVVQLSEFDRIYKKAETRPMVGQSPYMVNVWLGFENKKIGLSSNIAFNTGGEKLFLLTTGSTPFIYELPQYGLNWNIAKTFADKFELELSIDDILDSEYKAVHHGENGDKTFLSYTSGRTFGFTFKYFIK